MALPQATPIGRAFTDPVLQSQRVFRALLSAMAEPGTIHALDVSIDAPRGVMPASILALLALADKETPVWIGGDAGRDIGAYLRFHTGCPIASALGEAQFALLPVGAPAQPLASFNPGDERYPDRSATVVVECPALDGGLSRRWSGPGIRGARAMSVVAPFAEFWPEVRRNNAESPLGVDMILASGRCIVGLPRSTSVSELDGEG